MKKQTAALFAAILLSVCFSAGQSGTRKAPAAKTPPTIEGLVLEGKSAEAVRLARSSPALLTPSLKILTDKADELITDRKTDEANTILEKTARFLDDFDKASRKPPVPRDALTARQLRIQGIRLNAKRETKKAEEALQQALGLAQKLQDRLLESAILNNLGVTLQNQDKLEESCKQFEKSAKISEELKDPMRSASALFNLGLSLESLKKYDESLQAFRKAGDHFRAVSKTDLEARAILKQGIVVGRINAVSPEPLKLLGQAQKLFEKLGDDRNTGYAHYLMGDHIAYSQKFADAAACGERALPFLLRAGDKDLLLRCYDFLADMHKRTGKKDLADKYQKLADQLAAK